MSKTYNYVSSVAYQQVAQWAPNTDYPAGAIVRQLAPPVVNSERCFYCTVAGTSGAVEPSWQIVYPNYTTNDNTVEWYECTGIEVFQHANGVVGNWTAPAPRLACFGDNRTADVFFVSSDHSETYSGGDFIVLARGATEVISVDRTGNFPPTEADYAPGATISVTGANDLVIGASSSSVTWRGITFNAGSGSNDTTLFTNKDTLIDCGLCLLTTSVNSLIYLGAYYYDQGFSSFSGQDSVLLDNTYLQFSASAQLAVPVGQSKWIRTANPVRGTLPTTVFGTTALTHVNSFVCALDIEEVDFTGLGSGTLMTSGFTNSGVFVPKDVVPFWLNLRNCKLPSSIVLSASALSRRQFIALENCGIGRESVWYASNGRTITTATTTYRAGGATNENYYYSRRMINAIASTTGIVRELPLELHLSCYNEIVGTAQTAVVEINSNGLLANNQIWGELEYLGDPTTPGLSIFASNGLANPLVTPSSHPASSSDWTSDAIDTGITQRLEIGFTAEHVGLLNFVVYLAAANTAVYIDPMITLV